MPRRPCPRAVSLENRAFLRHLRATGNAHEAARRLDLSRTRFTKRRAQNPAFAAEWDAALAIAHAALAHATLDARPPAEPRTVRTANGRRQLRRAQPGRLTKDAEQMFLAALSATANIRLSAAATGFSHCAFYRHREAHPGFAREWRLALQRGYERVELALLESFDPRAHADDAWRHNDPPAMPPMTANQALQLLYLHQKAATEQDEPPHLKRRRGEPREAYSYRLAAMYEQRQQRAREAFAVAEAARAERGEPRHVDYLSTAPVLPDLSQVKGWSKADPAKKAHHADRALFGGWRLGDVKGEVGEVDE